MKKPGGQLGNRGGSRKSAYEEHSDAKWAADLWKIEQEVLKLQAKIQSRKYSARDMFALKCLTGNERILKALADKLLPDKIDFGGEGLSTLEILLRGIANKKEKDESD